MSVWRSRDPTNPNFQSVERAAADEDGRLGVGRLGGSTSTTFRHVKNFPYGTGALCAIWLATGLAGENASRASVVRKSRTSTPSASTTTAIVVFASALSSTSASRTPKCAAPVLPTTALRLSATVLAP